MIPLARPDITEAEVSLVVETLRSGWLTQGPRVAEFEREFAAYVGAGHAVAVSNCTTALHLSLVAAGIGPGEEVVVPSHSFIATANSVVHAGAIPVFADIEPATLNLDPASVDAAIGPKTKAVLAVHQVGRPARLEELAKLCLRRGVALLEDAACAVGSAYRGKRIGHNGLSPLVCFSFHPRKVLSTGDGGMITTGDESLARKLRLLRQHGMSVNDLARHRSKTIVNEEYSIIGFNFRLTDVQASLGLGQLRRLDAIVDRRRAIAARYDAGLTGAPGVELFQEPNDCRWNQQTYLLRLKGSNAATRDRFMQSLLDEDIATRRGVMSTHREPCHAGYLRRVSLAESERASDQCVCLPLYTAMTDAEIDRVVAAVRSHAPAAAS